MSSINLIILSGLVLLACNPTAKKSEPVAMSQQEVSEQVASTDQFSSAKMTIAQMVDPAYSESVDFGSLFKTMALTSEGAIETITEAQALELYQQAQESPPAAEDQMPIFESLTSNHAVLMVRGKGVTALLLVERTDLTVEELKFLPRSKTDKLGASRERFQDQFTGKPITFNSNNFGLKPWDAPKFEGDVQIDGISGATDVCEAAANMLNEQLPRYQAYFSAD